MRLQCPVETYTDNYVEFDERWSRAEVKKFISRNSLSMIETLQSKVTALHVRYQDGGVLDSPKDITEENLDRMQWEVFQWFITLPQVVMSGILDLGNAVRRQLLDTSEDSPDTEPSVTPQLTPTS